MVEDHAKRRQELVERLRNVKDLVNADPVVEALQIHGELVGLLAKSDEKLVKLNERLIESNENLLKSSEKTERWTKAVVLLTFALVALTLVLLFFTSVQVLLGSWEGLPPWGQNVTLIVGAAGFLAATVLVLAVIYYWVKAQQAAFPRTKG